MKTMLKVKFFVRDAEFNDEYNYTGYILDSGISVRYHL